MKPESEFTRRNWLRASALTVAAAGLAGPASAAPAGGETDPGIFNVMKYEAAGDGVADDTDALQKCIDAAGNYARGNVSKGGVVYLPAGVFKVSKTLLINQAVKIFGRGQATIDGAIHIAPTSLDFDVFRIVGVNWGVVLEGFLIKSSSFTGTGGHFLRIQDCQHVRVRGVDLVNCWNGALVDSCGDVVFQDLNVSSADVPGERRFGIKCTAASKGNANATQALNCGVSQWGEHVRTMDGFVLANGYNSFETINCGALNCNRGFWCTRDGGAAPNFFVVALGCSDHSKQAVVLDEGGYASFSEMFVTSSYVDNITVGKEMTGPVAFSNCVISTSGGPGYRIIAEQKPLVSITGGSVHDVSGNAIDIASSASVLVTGMGIADIRSGQNADGIAVSGSGQTTLAGISITDVKHIAIRVRPDFTGVLAFSGISQQNAARGLFDEGSSGTIAGSGSFRANSEMDADISKNLNAQSCIQCSGSIPSPFYPTPAMPASGNAVNNTSGTNCMVYITGRNVKEVIVDGISLGRQNAVHLPVNRAISIRYTGALSWVWQRVA